MKKIFLRVAVCLCAGTATAQNQPPTLSNIQITTSGTLLTLSYDLSDPESDPVTISFRAGQAGAAALDFDTGNAAGDLGSGITPGTGKQIQWDYSSHATGQPNFRLMLVADDLQPVDIQALVNQADSLRLLNDLLAMEGVRHRSTGVTQLANTKSLLLNTFQANGLNTWEQTFPYGSYTASNIAGQKPGISQETSACLISAHFDSVSDSPGADDNASGVAGMLEVMRLLSGYSFEKTVRFIGFDLEEVGLKGSQRYVQEGILPGETMAGLINLEMIGYYTEAPFSQTVPAGFNLLFPDVYNELVAENFKGDFINNIGEVMHSLPLMSSFESHAADYVPSLKVKSLAAPVGWQTLTPDLGRSDHAPFWVAGLPALMISDGSNFRNPNYHTSHDTAGSLNLTFMTRVVQATAATMATLAGIRHAATWSEEVELPSATAGRMPCDIRLSPNPSGRVLSLVWGDCRPAGALIFKMTDLQGKVWFEQTIDFQSQSQIVIQLGELPPGIYVASAGSWQQRVVVAQ